MVERCKLEDVARRAGISLSTASLVMSDQGRISTATRARVLEAARELGYSPKRRKSGDRVPTDRPHIALLFDIDPEGSLINTLIRPIIQEFERTLAQAGYDTLLLPVSRREGDADMVEKVRSSGVAGVATIHIASPEFVTLLEAAGIPVVIMMNSTYQERFYTVCVDDFQGAYEGASFLLRSGHRKIGYLDCERLGLVVLPVDRYFGFKKAIEEYAVDFDESMRGRLPEGGAADVIAWLEDFFRSRPGITALFALDDELAWKAVSVAARLGIRVPEDLSVIAPGDVLDYSLCYVPQITTMRIDTSYMGRISAQMMLNRITHNPLELHVLKVKQLLVRRGSVRELGADRG
jgi:LacI family transcriptional regulator